MTPSATIRAKLAIVVLLTLLYGSVCSATCTLGACPTGAQDPATHDCDHSSSRPAHHQTPQNPACPKHQHPTFEAVKTDALAQSELTGADRATAQLLAFALHNEAFAASSRSSFSDLAPPPDPASTRLQQTSVLRI